MVNYGYACLGWSEKKKDILVERLSVLVEKYADKYGMTPYVEKDVLYTGIRIRRITHIPEEDVRMMMFYADNIYREVESSHN